MDKIVTAWGKGIEYGVQGIGEEQKEEREGIGRSEDASRGGNFLGASAV